MRGRNIVNRVEWADKKNKILVKFLNSKEKIENPESFQRLLTKQTDASLTTLDVRSNGTMPSNF